MWVYLFAKCFNVLRLLSIQINFYLQTLFSLQFRAHAMWVHLFVQSFNVLVFIFKIIFFVIRHCSLCNLGLTLCGSICL